MITSKNSQLFISIGGKVRNFTDELSGYTPNFSREMYELAGLARNIVAHQPGRMQYEINLNGVVTPYETYDLKTGTNADDVLMLLVEDVNSAPPAVGADVIYLGMVQGSAEVNAAAGSLVTVTGDFSLGEEDPQFGLLARPYGRISADEQSANIITSAAANSKYRVLAWLYDDGATKGTNNIAVHLERASNDQSLGHVTLNPTQNVFQLSDELTLSATDNLRLQITATGYGATVNVGAAVILV